MTSHRIPTPLDEQRKVAVKQFRAGICLIEKSGLLEFEQSIFEFRGVSESTFEEKARDLDEHFGRVMYWLWFSTGAEYLLKGFVIVQDKDFLKKSPKAIPLPEAGPKRDPDWVGKVISNHGAEEPQGVFSTMILAEQLERRLSTQIPHGIKPSLEEARRTKASYLILKDAIRNRDSHAYVESVRQSHYHMVHDFAPAFNTLLAAAGAKYLLT